LRDCRQTEDQDGWEEEEFLFHKMIKNLER
jgi:hypothetical protein